RWSDVAFATRGWLVSDPSAGFRAQQFVHFVKESAALGVPTATESFDVTTKAFGLLHSPDLDAELRGPRILLLGDEQCFAGARESDRIAARVEAALRTRHPSLADLTVFDASCPRSALLDRVLRAPQWIAAIRPHVVVVVIATGDDALGFDDPSSVHFDEILDPRAPRSPPNDDPFGLSSRAAEFAPGHPGLVAHDLGQAALLGGRVGALDALPERWRRCLQSLRAVAPRNGLLCVLVPSVSVARRAEVLPLLTPAGRELADAEVNRQVHDSLLAALDSMHVAWLDALPIVSTAVTSRTGDVYRTNGCLGAAGHAAVGDRIAERLAFTLRVR
ncbi:MAG: hypothetical protein AB7T19_18755, partial [Planctomycetota bacterium]